MITAICFINTNPAHISSAGNLVAIIEVADHDQVASVVADQLGKIDGVTSTETHIAFRTYDKRDLEAGFAIGN